MRRRVASDHVGLRGLVSAGQHPTHQVTRANEPLEVPTVAGFGVERQGHSQQDPALLVLVLCEGGHSQDRDNDA